MRNTLGGGVVLGVAAAVVMAGSAYAGGQISDRHATYKPAPATTTAAVPKPAGPRVFHESAPFYQRLPDDTPTASDSDELVAALKRQTKTFYGTPGKPMVDVNVDKFAGSLWTAAPDDPKVSVRPWNCQNKPAGWEAELAAELEGIRIPDGMKPDPSSDGSVTIHDPQADTMVDLWQARKAADGVWEACWGGKMRDVSKSTTATYPHPFGSSAAGISHAAYVIRHDELKAGRIDHAINLMLPEIKAWPAVSWPANRTDGHYQGPALTMGQWLRLPADVDVDSLGLSPAAATIARAAQEYGIVITDTAGSVTFQAENPIALESSDYDAIFGGRWPSEALAGFPVDRLEVLPVDYRKPSGG